MLRVGGSRLKRIGPKLEDEGENNENAECVGLHSTFGRVDIGITALYSVVGYGNLLDAFVRQRERFLADSGSHKPLTEQTYRRCSDAVIGRL